jgi:hypothetical protein
MKGRARGERAVMARVARSGLVRDEAGMKEHKT